MQIKNMATVRKLSFSFQFDSELMERQKYRHDILY